MKEFNYILLGWALAMTASSFFMGWLLYKKPTTENHIKSQKQKIKRNKGSNSSNDMNVKQNQENPTNEKKPRKERKIKRLFKRKSSIN